MSKEDIAKLKTWWCGAHEPHDHTSAKNVINAILMLLAAVPTIVYCRHVMSQEIKLTEEELQSTTWDYEKLKADIEGKGFDYVMYANPLLMINVMFLFNIDIGCWIIGLLEHSFWLIDPMWSILPPIYGVLWAMHPLAVVNTRVQVAVGLTFLWAIRLTHSYFRREGWKFGEQEDWRYTYMAIDFGRPLWYFVSFFATGLAQHPMIVGISLPLYSVCFGPDANRNFDEIDCIIATLCTIGIIIAYFSDTQLYNYMKENSRRRKNGEAVISILNTGMWRYSRHPNYFGEQLWWWSLSMFAVRAGQPWAVAGQIFNAYCLVDTVKKMTEDKMIKNWSTERADLYREYQRTTSSFIPWTPKCEVKKA